MPSLASQIRTWKYSRIIPRTVNQIRVGWCTTLEPWKGKRQRTLLLRARKSPISIQNSSRWLRESYAVFQTRICIDYAQQKHKIVMFLALIFEVFQRSIIKAYRKEISEKKAYRSVWGGINYNYYVLCKSWFYFKNCVPSWPRIFHHFIVSLSFFLSPRLSC